jgi:hypothetical protein
LLQGSIPWLNNVRLIAVKSYSCHIHCYPIGTHLFLIVSLVNEKAESVNLAIQGAYQKRQVIRNTKLEEIQVEDREFQESVQEKRSNIQKEHEERLLHIRVSSQEGKDRAIASRMASHQAAVDELLKAHQSTMERLEERMQFLQQ